MFKSHYQDELEILEALLRPFARRHPEAAGELGFQGHDRNTQRLFQGTAFLFARLREQLEAPHLELLAPLLERAGAPLSAPVPCASIVAFRPQEALQRKPGWIPRHASVLADHPEEGPVRFRTLRPVTLLPLVLDGWQHIVESGTRSRLLGRFRIFPGATTRVSDPHRVPDERPDPVAALAITRRTGTDAPTPAPVTPAKAGISSMVLYATGGSARQYPLVVALMQGLNRVSIEAHYGPAAKLRVKRTLPTSLLHALPWDPHSALLPPDALSLAEMPVLLEALTLPQHFCFFELSGLDWLFALGQLSHFTVTLDLESSRLPLYPPGPDCLLPHCVPVVNLFAGRAESITTSEGRRFYRIHVRDSAAEGSGGSTMVPESPASPAASRARVGSQEIHDVVGVSGLRRKATRIPYRARFSPGAHSLQVQTGASSYRVIRRLAIADPAARSSGEMNRRIRTFETYLELQDSEGKPPPGGQTLDIDLLLSQGTLPESIAPRDISRPSSDIPSSVRFHGIEPLTHFAPARPPELRSWSAVRSRRRDLGQLQNRTTLEELLRGISGGEGCHAEQQRSLDHLLDAIEGVQRISVIHVLGMPPGPLAGYEWHIQVAGERLEPLERFYPLAVALFQSLCSSADRNTSVSLIVRDKQSPEEWRWGPTAGHAPLI